MKAIINATLVMPDHYIPNATLLMENDRIVDFGKKLDVPDGAEIIDAQGNFVGPGLIDIHTRRICTHGPITPYLPSSMLQTKKTQVYISEELAAPYVKTPKVAVFC